MRFVNILKKKVKKEPVSSFSLALSLSMTAFTYFTKSVVTISTFSVTGSGKSIGIGFITFTVISTILLSYVLMKK